LLKKYQGKLREFGINVLRRIKAATGNERNQTGEIDSPLGKFATKFKLQASKFAFAIYFRPIVLTARVSVLASREEMIDVESCAEHAKKGRDIVANIYSSLSLFPFLFFHT